MAMDKEVWNDISTETEREYIYKDFTLKVEKPVSLHVSASSFGGHSHRIKTADGTAYYVAPGWIAIRWWVREGSPLFTF